MATKNYLSVIIDVLIMVVFIMEEIIIVSVMVIVNTKIGTKQNNLKKT